MNFYLAHNYSGEANVRMLPVETFEAESCVRGYHTYQANFWYKVWIEAGCPSSGVLHSRFKYEVRRLKRREHHLHNEKLIAALAANKSKDFWKDIKYTV